MAVSAKEPQDRKPKQTKPADEDVSEAFEFEHDGTSYTLKPTADALNLGFLRRHRNAEQQQVLFDLLEALAELDVLAVLDDMPLRESKDMLAAFDTHVEHWLGATMGESSAS